MLVSEIASGNPSGLTFADENLFLLVEGDQEEDIQDTISDITENIKKLASPTLTELTSLIDSLKIHSKTTIVLAYQEDSVVHFLLKGKGAVFLKRGKECALLLSGGAIATGPTMPHDSFILCGPSFLSIVTLSVFTILMGNANEEEVEKHIVSYVEQHGTGGTLCLLLHNKKEEASNHEPAIHEVPPPKFSRSPIHFPKLNILSSVTGRLSSLSPHTKQQRLTFLVGCLLLFLLIASLIFGSTQRNKATASQRLEEITTVANQDLGEAEKLVDLSPEQALPLISHAEELLTKAQSEFPEDSDEYAAISRLLERTAALSQQAKKIYTATPEMFFDIAWLKEGGQGDKIAITEDAFYLTDPAHKSIYRVGLPQKKAEIVGTHDIFSESAAITAAQSTPYIFVEGNDTHLVNGQGNSIISHNDQWGKISDIASFGGNIYLLDTNGIIWKHAGTENGFGSSTKWLNETTTVNFQDATSLAIDGSIWVLKPTEVIKLTMGGIDPFFLRGDSIRNSKQVWTSDKTTSLFVLEEGRVVVFDKEGRYEKQYVWSDSSSVSDFAVSENLNKILLVTGNKVLSIDFVL